MTGTMTLGELRDALARCERKASVRLAPFGLWWQEIDSWRGIYAEPTIHYALDAYNRRGESQVVTVEKALSQIDAALAGREFYGYKGGSFVFDRSSPVHADNTGAWTSENRVLRVIGESHTAWILVGWEHDG